MVKLSRKLLDPEDLGLYINNLWSAFTLAATKEDIRLLFKDLFSHTEYKMFAKRLEVARRLLRKEKYEKIVKDLKVTPPTIAKMSNILEEKGEGLRKAVENINRLEEAYFRKKIESTKNLENPFRKKVLNHRKTVLSEIIKAGLKAADQKMTRHQKIKSAANKLDI